MRLLDHIRVLPGFSVAQHLAVDETLLLDVGRQDCPNETLRLWESPQTAVVVGRSSRVETEVVVTRCQQSDVPVVRRCSGGCAIVAGPGCLMYSVALDLRHRPHLRVIDQAHEFVLEKILAALRLSGIHNASRMGLSDLVVSDADGRTSEESVNYKFSGNSLRITREALLYHGTVLYDFPLEQISELLKQPPREPDYRHQRNHQQFVKNLDASRDQVVTSLGETWGATEPMTTLSIDAVNALVREKYAQRDWNFRH